MNIREQLLCLVIIIVCSIQLYAQEKDDVNTPLHLLPANYPTLYKAPDKVLVKGTLDRIFNYINQNTPPELIDTVTGKKIDSPASLTKNVILKKGV